MKNQEVTDLLGLVVIVHQFQFMKSSGLYDNVLINVIARSSIYNIEATISSYRDLSKEEKRYIEDSLKLFT